MIYNTCNICGANGGRAGMLIGNPTEGKADACLNCHDTRDTGNIVIHSHLVRTEDELKKTMDILSVK